VAREGAVIDQIILPSALEKAAVSRWVGRLGPATWANGDGPRVVDLCAGCGGLSLGFNSAGFRVVAAVEIDAMAAEVHRRNFPEVVLFGPGSAETPQGDIARVTGQDILSAVGLEVGDIDLVVGGPPCQGFSSIGLRRNDDPRNVLYRQFVRLVGELRPRAYLLENVPRMMSVDDGKVYAALAASLEVIGYSATPALVNAATYGVPQLRTRLFVAGTDDGTELGIANGPSTADAYVTTGAAIGDLPDDITALPLTGPTELPYGTAPPSEYARLLRGRNTVVRHMTPTLHADDVRARLQALGPGEEDRSTRHRRLDPDTPAWTLLAGSRTRTACRPIHPTQPRVITAREAARLHSLPDEFWLPELKSCAHMVIGNSVPPLLVHHLASHIAARAFEGTAPRT